MRATSKLEITGGRLSAIRKRHDVVIFEKTRLSAATLRTDKSATTFVALPDRPL